MPGKDNLKRGFFSDPLRVCKAVATNQLARFAPAFYVRLTGETGRGKSVYTPEQTAAYFRQCVAEYFEVLKLSPKAGEDFLRGRHILEYGPGDIPGVALLLVAMGAERVTCVDRFPLMALSEYNQAVMRVLLNGLTDTQRDRAAGCFRVGGDPASGLAENGPLRYLTNRNGLSDMRGEVSLVLSRAVLEHVHDVEAIFADMRRALEPGGIALHQVDLKSHGLHRQNPLDFLTWSPFLWRLMYSEKGVPNRLRRFAFVRAAEKAGLNIELMQPTVLAESKDVAAVRPQLADVFRLLDDEELSWLGFWMKCRAPR